MQTAPVVISSKHLLNGYPDNQDTLLILFQDSVFFWLNYFFTISNDKKKAENFFTNTFTVYDLKMCF